MTAEAQPLSVPIAARKPQSLLKAHMELGKVRLNAMVVFTTMLGFVVGSEQLDPPGINWLKLLWTCLGTFLAAVGASAFNQAIEARRDARMNRTRNRPLCTGRLSRTYAASFGLIISICGVAILCPTSNGLAAILAAGTVILYAMLYTPLKPISTTNTLVGAIVGGIPPVLGYAAATNEVTFGALLLGGILFVWQIPHFLALCWIYREDYARGGFKMLPIIDATGMVTSRMALMYALLLIPLCLLLTFFGYAGFLFVITALLLTMALVMVALRFVSSRANADARKLFFASIIYLPLLSMALMADAAGPLSGYDLTLGGYVSRDPHPEQFRDPEAPLKTTTPEQPVAPAKP